MSAQDEKDCQGSEKIKVPFHAIVLCSAAWTRTKDQSLNRRSLYQLSYRGIRRYYHEIEWYNNLVRNRASIAGLLVILLVSIPQGLFAASVAPIDYTSKLYFSPKTITVKAGSTFDVSLYIDTEGFSINTADVQINFNPDRLSVVTPSAGQSIFGVWITPPQYSNTTGRVNFSGVVPGGIKTSGGLVQKMTFKAISPGTTSVSVSGVSRLLINDGFGTEADVQTVPLQVVIEPTTPDGVEVVSATHPFQGDWYNNNNPVFSWEKKDGDQGYSYSLDDKPFTVPDDTIDGTESQMGYENLKDGVWYFHLKAKVGGYWSAPTHYMVRIDTTPPAVFTPTVKLFRDAGNTPGILSFFTTDALSGLAHYEVGVLEAGSSKDTLPAFIESASPYYLSQETGKDLLVTIRAIDKAGNVRDTTFNVVVPGLLWAFVSEYWLELSLLGAALLLLVAVWSFSRKRNRYRNEWRREEVLRLIDEAVERRRLPQPTTRVMVRPRQEETPQRIFDSFR